MLRAFASLILDWLILAAVALLVAGIASATPAPPTPKGHDLQGVCGFGEVTQRGNRVFITGPVWSASGVIKGDLLLIEWTQLGTGRTAIATYEIDGMTLGGHWGWADECEWTDTGDVCGEIHGEVIRITRPEPPGIDQ